MWTIIYVIRLFGKTNKSHSTAEIQPELEKFAQQMHLVLTRSVESLLVSLKYDLSYKKRREFTHWQKWKSNIIVYYHIINSITSSRNHPRQNEATLSNHSSYSSMVFRINSEYSDSDLWRNNLLLNWMKLNLYSIFVFGSMIRMNDILRNTIRSSKPYQQTNTQERIQNIWSTQ